MLSILRDFYFGDLKLSEIDDPRMVDCSRYEKYLEALKQEIIQKLDDDSKVTFDEYLSITY